MALNPEAEAALRTAQSLVPGAPPQIRPMVMGFINVVQGGNNPRAALKMLPGGFQGKVKAAMDAVVASANVGPGRTPPGGVPPISSKPSLMQRVPMWAWIVGGGVALGGLGYVALKK